MWVKRTQKEIAKLERHNRLSRFDPTLPILGAFAYAAIDCIARWAGVYHGGRGHPAARAIPFDEAILYFPLIFSVSFLVIYFCRMLITPKPLTAGTLICTQCFEPAIKDSQQQCSCGGTREPMYYWRWQKDV